MNQLSAFIARLKANPVMASAGAAFIFSAFVLSFPKWFKFLPPEAFDALWNGAIKVFTFGIGIVVLFMKQHSSVGDPAKPDVATFQEAKDTPATPPDWRSNASGQDQP